MVKVYSITTCPWCDKAKKYLKSKGIEYEEHNIENSDEDAQACLKLSGDTMVPVITNDDVNYVVGFDKAKIDQMLDIQ
ncbi:MAG: glutathione S-transferase N-terminal domain-containing protein [Selenomonadaceae bacterium]|nr:glutathione S-transferase N-terminal domain-containing protein [Selenomonadaceae bacterium]